MNKNDIKLMANALGVSTDAVASWYYGNVHMSDYLPPEQCLEFTFDRNSDVVVAEALGTDLAEIFEECTYVPGMEDYAIEYMLYGNALTPHGGRSLEGFTKEAIELFDNFREVRVKRHLT